MRRSRLRSYVDVGAVLACEVALVVFFWESRPVLGSVDFAHFGQWLDTTSPARALSALVRLLGLAISGWLVLSTLLYAVAALSGHKWLLRRSRRVTIPWVRRVVDAVAVASLAASAIGTTVGGAFASPAPRATAFVRSTGPQGSVGATGAPSQPARVTATSLARAPGIVFTKAKTLAGGQRHPVASDPVSRTSDDLVGAPMARVSTTAVGRHFPHPGDLQHVPPPKAAFAPTHGVVPSVENGFAGLPKGTKVVVVQPGDCLSVIAQRYLGDWRLDTQIEALNYGRPQPDGLALVDDHWIYPGWVLVMPQSAVGTIVVGETTAAYHGGMRGEGLGVPNGESVANPATQGADDDARVSTKVASKPPARAESGDKGTHGETCAATGRGETVSGSEARINVGRSGPVAGKAEAHEKGPRGAAHANGTEAGGEPSGNGTAAGAEAQGVGVTPGERPQANGDAAATGRREAERSSSTRGVPANGTTPANGAVPANGAGPANAAASGHQAAPTHHAALAHHAAPAGSAAHSAVRGVRPPSQSAASRKGPDGHAGEHSTAPPETSRAEHPGPGFAVVAPHGTGKEKGAVAEEHSPPKGAGGHPTEQVSHRDAESVVLAGLGAVAAAGVVWRVERARRERAHARPKGRVYGPNRPPVQAAERRARAVASEEAMRWVDLGLRYLGALVEQAACDAVTGGTFGFLPPEDADLAADGQAGAAWREAGAASRGEAGTEDRADRLPGPDGSAIPAPEVPGVPVPVPGGAEDIAFERWWKAGDGSRGEAVPPARQVSRNTAGVPSLVMVRVGAGGFEVVLSPVPAGRFGWFSPDPEATVHVLDPDIGLEDLEALASERWPAWPALVAVGEADGSTVLLNLEHAGVLSVEGPPDRVRGTLAAIALQLATQPWADEMLGGLYAVGEHPLLAGLPGRVQHVEPAAAMDLAEKLDGMATARQELAGAASLSTVRAVACEALPNVAIAFAGTPADALRCLGEAAVPEQSGVALVVAGPVDGATWRLSLEGSSRAVLYGPAGEVTQLAERAPSTDGVLRGDTGSLEPLDGDGEPNVAQELDGGGGEAAATEELRVELVSAFDAEEVALLSEAVGGPSEERLVDITTGATNGNGASVGAAARLERHEVEIRLLGPVDVVGGDMEAVGSSRIMAALGVLAYLAAHPRPVPAEELASALWPLDATKENYGGPQRKTVMNAVSRARAVLGYGTNGKERLVLGPQGYRLSSEVGSDWARFDEHVSMARSRHGEEAAVHLRAALELVRGEPFGGALASQFFEWVASEHLDMTLAAKAVDVAQDLGELALEAGDFPTVYWAVDKGLSLEPTREELFRLWMHALGREGRPAKVDDVYRRLKLVLRQRIHPLQEPQRESWEVWRSYTAVESFAGGRPGEW